MIKKINKYSSILLFPCIAIFISSWYLFIDRSLWLDEAFLALNIIEKTYFDLLKPLDYFQISPVLFLWIEKFTFSFFNNDLGLRVFPILCYWLSIFFYFKFTQLLFKDIIITNVAVSIYCSIPFIFGYSVEIKQYVVDILAITSLFYFFIQALNTSEKNNKWIYILTITGMICLFLSHISIVIITTISIVLLIKIFYIKLNRKWLIVIICWFICFILHYFFFLKGDPGIC